MEASALRAKRGARLRPPAVFEAAEPILRDDTGQIHCLTSSPLRLSCRFHCGACHQLPLLSDILCHR